MKRTVYKESAPPRLHPALLANPLNVAGLISVCAFVAALVLYAPALNGKFTFDDLSLPLHLKTAQQLFDRWSHNVRPVLMSSYFLNYHLWGASPFSYHMVNLFIHVINTALVFLIMSRLLAMSGWERSRAATASIIGASIFLVHPLQTEAVSYIAGRSESLASLFVLLAYSVFLYRRHECITWLESLAVLILFGLGILTKENVVSLAGVLVLTDLYWPVPFSWQGLRRNRRLYVLMIPGVTIAVFAVFRLLSSAATAGFSSPLYKWYQYFFTEARVLFVYMRLAVWPVGQSLDHDYLISHTITEHGALIYMLLMGGLVVLSIRLRHRYPLFCFGLLLYLILLAPTSSFVPIDDAVVERRMYLPLVGLILIAVEIGSRVRLSHAMRYCAIAAVILVLCAFSYQRNRLWGNPDQLLASAAIDSTHNPRPLLNLTEILIQDNRCDLAASYVQRAEHVLGNNNYYVHVAWGRTLACQGRYAEALLKFQAAAQIQPTSQVWEWIGLTYGKLDMPDQAGEALREAVKLGPDSVSAHGSLALWYEKANNLRSAEQEYEISLSLDSTDQWAKAGLMRVYQERVAAGQPRTPKPVN